MINVTKSTQNINTSKVAILIILGNGHTTMLLFRPFPYSAYMLHAQML